MKKVIEKAYLVGSYFEKSDKKDAEVKLDELAQLAKTAGLQVEEVFLQYQSKPNPSTFVGKGKIEEIKNKALNKDIAAIVFNDTLSPTQARNIAKFLKCNVVDRTELILDIFAKHARTKQSKLQVELAQLNYNYSRLRRMWSHLSRIEGGIGFRGPGEKQIELDRREIKKKINILKEKLEKIKKQTATKSKSRKKATTISLVGYTNAGKSTLFNRLTEEDIYVADKLFATLDSTTRTVKGDIKDNVTISDTIGFINDIPHLLVESFYSTLSDVRNADLLLHVVDISNPFYEDNISSVDSVLKEIGVEDKNILMVFNKVDKFKHTKALFVKKQLAQRYPHAVFLSAKTGEKIDNLLEKINYFLSRKSRSTNLRIPIKMTKLLNFIHKNTEIIEKNFLEEANEFEIEANVPDQFLTNIIKQIEEYKFLESLESK